MDTKLSARMHTWHTLIDYRITPPNRFGRWVCVSETLLRSHICHQKSRLLSQTSVAVLGGTAAGPVVQAAFTPFIWAQMDHTWQTGTGPYQPSQTGQV